MLRARRALGLPFKHSVCRIKRAATLVRKHHGSQVPNSAKVFLREMTKTYKCACGWSEKGSSAAKRAKKEGHCKWCTAPEQTTTAAVPSARADSWWIRQEHAGGDDQQQQVRPSCKAEYSEEEASGDTTVEIDEGDAAGQRFKVLKQDEAFLRGQVRTAKLFHGELAEKHLRGLEGQLAGVVNEIKMSRPVNARLKTLRKDELKAKQANVEAEQAVEAKRVAVQKALAEFDEAKVALEDTKLTLATVQDLVAQAALEKADYQASKLGQQVTNLVGAMQAIADQCGDDTITGYLHKAIEAASEADRTKVQAGQSMDTTTHNPNTHVGGSTGSGDGNAAANFQAGAAAAETAKIASEQERPKLSSMQGRQLNRHTRPSHCLRAGRLVFARQHSRHSTTTSARTSRGGSSRWLSHSWTRDPLLPRRHRIRKSHWWSKSRRTGQRDSKLDVYQAMRVRRLLRRPPGDHVLMMRRKLGRRTEKR